eukprot:SAG25_NODE_2853_length_1350_cov_1.590727_3_plen_105_part_00
MGVRDMSSQGRQPQASRRPAGESTIRRRRGCSAATQAAEAEAPPTDLAIMYCCWPDAGGAAMGRFPSVGLGLGAWPIIPAAVTPSLYVTDTVCVGHMYPTIALP